MLVLGWSSGVVLGFKSLGTLLLEHRIRFVLGYRGRKIWEFLEAGFEVPMPGAPTHRAASESSRRWLQVHEVAETTRSTFSYHTANSVTPGSWWQETAQHAQPACWISTYWVPLLPILHPSYTGTWHRQGPTRWSLRLSLNFLNFCLPGNVLISPLFLKVSFVHIGFVVDIGSENSLKIQR